ncbi:TniQ family protein [Paracoccus caeni]|uniref:TniQ family protein n=1 Tax=Paracoccus caeni TaxID=657651 RepID=A0A934VX79_9RHOB|nr:TniQ family protein [Paracoccus caeni]MBK4214712.1 TniQ family protein [Paracoccus caeni]
MTKDNLNVKAATAKSANYKILPLPVLVAAGPTETATSLASRLTLANGAPRMLTLCNEMSISHTALCHGASDAVERIAQLAATDPTNLLFHTPRLIRKGWFRIGNEDLKFSILLRRGGQICQLCIGENRDLDARLGPWQPSLWQISAFRRCPIHNIIYERPSFACKPDDFLDFARLIAGWIPEKIMPGPCGERELDAYLAKRIEVGAGQEWIDQQPLHVIHSCAEALGLAVRNGPGFRVRDASTLELISAGNEGIKWLATGKEGLLAILADLLAASGADRANYGKIYTTFLSCLIERRLDPDFDPIRDIVREFIRDHFYIPAETSLLGRICDTPRVYTVATAAKTFDVPISHLSRYLVRESRIVRQTRKNTISDVNTLVPVGVMRGAVMDVRKLSTLAVSRTVLGIDRFVMERLCEAGLLSPRLGSEDGGMPLYHLDDLLAFIHGLRKGLVPLPQACLDWKPITKIAARCHCSTAWLLQQVASKRLALGTSLKEPFRLDDFLVSLSEVKRLLLASPEGKVSAMEAAALLGVNAKTIHALAEAGFLESEKIDSRLANRDRLVIGVASLESFARCHVVLRALSGTRKSTYQATQDFIAAQNVHPLSLGQSARWIYLRKDIERIATRPGGEKLPRLLDAEDAKLRVIGERLSERNSQKRAALKASALGAGAQP